MYTHKDFVQNEKIERLRAKCNIASNALKDIDNELELLEKGQDVKIENIREGLADLMLFLETVKQQ